MTNPKQVSLPIIGMTCANCVAAVEKSLNKTEGVEEASVNLSSERASVRFDSGKVQLSALVEHIRSAGYDVALGDWNTAISGLSDPADALHLEKAIDAVDGVLYAKANIGTEKLTVRYIPTIVSVSELRQAVQKVGFRSADRANTEVDEETARQHEISRQRRMLIIALAFTLPLFVLSMSRDLTCCRAHWLTPWMDWLFFALATPVQFYVGASYYVNGYKSLRNGSANMDPRCAWYLNGLFLLLSRFARCFSGHGCFETLPQSPP